MTARSPLIGPLAVLAAVCVGFLGLVVFLAGSQAGPASPTGSPAASVGLVTPSRPTGTAVLPSATGPGSTLPTAASPSPTTAATAVPTAGPALTPVPTRTPAPPRRERAAPIDTTLSAFAGYAIHGAKRFTSAEITWIEPTVTCDSVRPALVGIWVGIQDARTNLEQVGTAAFCVKGSGPVHRAFWELYPAPPHYFSLTVRPGDRMRARVRVSSSNQFTLSIWNLTTGRSASTSVRKNVRLVMAEWIVEAPANASTLRAFPLARFSPVKVIGASVTGDGVTTVIDDARWTVTRIAMVRSGRTLATTSALTSNGRGFTVRWRHH